MKMTEPGSNLLAVYGTLKKGFGNHALIERLGLEFKGRAFTEDSHFFMRGDTGFPYVYIDPMTKGLRNTNRYRHNISVELYKFERLEDIASIDALEGHPVWYTRQLYNFFDEQGIRRLAWMYVQKNNYPDDFLQHPTLKVKMSGVTDIVEWNPK